MLHFRPSQSRDEPPFASPPKTAPPRSGAIARISPAVVKLNCPQSPFPRPQDRKGRIIAIGDVHGCADEFETLLGRLALTRHDRVVLVGDLVNRGPDSARVLELARRHAHRSLLGNHERLSAARALEVGLVSEVCPSAELEERAGWVADTIASAPSEPVQATLRTLWAGRELSRQQALSLGNSFLNLGMSEESLAEGQATFAAGSRAKPRIR